MKLQKDTNTSFSLALGNGHSETFCCYSHTTVAQACVKCVDILLFGTGNMLEVLHGLTDLPLPVLVLNLS